MPLRASVQSPAPEISNRVKPVVLGLGNRYTMRNGGKLNCVETAFECLVNGDDVLDSLLAGVNIVELDPQDTSVGFSGSPNADGVALHAADDSSRYAVCAENGAEHTPLEALIEGSAGGSTLRYTPPFQK